MLHPIPSLTVTCQRNPLARAFHHSQKERTKGDLCTFSGLVVKKDGNTHPLVCPGSTPVGGISQLFMPAHLHPSWLANCLRSGWVIDHWLWLSAGVHLPVKNQESGKGRIGCISANERLFHHETQLSWGPERLPTSMLQRFTWNWMLWHNTC